MRPLSQADWAALNQAVRRLYAAESAELLRQTTLQELDRLVPSDYSSFNEFDFTAGEAIVHLGADAPEITRRLPVFQAHISGDPHVLYTARTGDCGAHQVTDLVSQRQFRQTPIYCEFYREIEVEYRSAFFLQRQGQLEIAVALLRRLSPFAGRELALMDAFRPHLEQAYFNVARLERAKQEGLFQSAVLDHSPHGFVLLTVQAEVYWMSARAAEWFGVYCPGAAKRGGLPDEVRRWVLRESKRFAAPTCQAPAFPLEILRPDSRLSIQMTLRPEGQVLLVLSETRFGMQSERLESLGLTPRQAEVLYWISEGKSNPEIGEVLGMSRRTADKHVENILDKLGVDNRAAAMLLAREHR
jgi:DNA-binding CsgD family transcriptional regulator